MHYFNPLNGNEAQSQDLLQHQLVFRMYWHSSSCVTYRKEHWCFLKWCINPDVFLQQLCGKSLSTVERPKLFLSKLFFPTPLFFLHLQQEQKTWPTFWESLSKIPEAVIFIIIHSQTSLKKQGKAARFLESTVNASSNLIIAITSYHLLLNKWILRIFCLNF